LVINARQAEIRIRAPFAERLARIGARSVVIARILPEIPGQEQQPPARAYMLYPGGTVPRFGIELTNRRGDLRFVRVDPITGSPIIERPQ